MRSRASLRRWGAGLLAACSLGLLGMSADAAGDARKAVTHTVTIDATRYEPAILTVRPGDSIVWVNKDLIPHTVTSSDGRFDSRVIAAGASWTYAPKAKGDADYVCSFHPTMKGTVRVR